MTVSSDGRSHTAAFNALIWQPEKLSFSSLKPQAVNGSIVQRAAAGLRGGQGRLAAGGVAGAPPHDALQDSAVA